MEEIVQVYARALFEVATERGELDEIHDQLDAFADAIHKIVAEDPQTLHEAPHSTLVSRPDDVQAARKPILKWEPSAS